MNVSTEKILQPNGASNNGHGGNGNGHGPDLSELRFKEISAELERLPAVMSSSLAQKPAWLAYPVEKARGLFLMVVKKTGPTEDGSYRVSKGVAGIFIASLLSLATAVGYGLLSQRDQITRLQTLQEVQQRDNVDMANKLDQVRNFTTVNDKNMARIEGKIDQFMQVYNAKNADKANITFQRE